MATTSTVWVNDGRPHPIPPPGQGGRRRRTNRQTPPCWCARWPHLHGPQAVFDQAIATIIPYDRAPICYVVRDAVAGVKEPGSCHGNVGPGARPDLGRRQHRRLHRGPPAGRVCTDVVHYERSRALGLPTGPARQCRRPRAGLRVRHSHIAPRLSEQPAGPSAARIRAVLCPDGRQGRRAWWRGRSAIDGGMWPCGEAGRAKFRWTDWAQAS